MTEETRLFLEAYNEIFSNDDVLNRSGSPLELFECPFVEGPLLDIGCGHASMLLAYYSIGRELYAIDNDQEVLDLLRNRVEGIPDADIEKWHFEKLTLFEDKLPLNKYSIVNISNLLHFFPLAVSQQHLANLLDPITRAGSVVNIIVHSVSHPENGDDNPNRYAYFKHFFSEEDINGLFPSEVYKRLYFEDTKRELTKKEKSLVRLWAEKWAKSKMPSNVVDPKYLKFLADQFLDSKKSESIASLHAIFVRTTSPATNTSL